MVTSTHSFMRKFFFSVQQFCKPCRDEIIPMLTSHKSQETPSMSVFDETGVFRRVLSQTELKHNTACCHGRRRSKYGKVGNFEAAIRRPCPSSTDSLLGRAHSPPITRMYHECGACILPRSMGWCEACTPTEDCICRSQRE